MPPRFFPIYGGLVMWSAQPTDTEKVIALRPSFFKI